MPTTTQITVTQLDVNSARCQALFSSGLQRVDARGTFVVNRQASLQLRDGARS